jgi:hypothetical protein
MAINLAQKYSSVVSERFTKESVTAIATNHDYDWEGVDTVKVYSVGTVPLTDYTRSGVNRFGTLTDLQDTVQTMKLTQDKAFTYVVDRGDNIEQMNIKQAATTLARQVREVITPALDMYRLGVMTAAATAAGQVIATAPTQDNIVDLLGQCSVYLTNALVPTLGRTLWINASTANMLVLNTKTGFQANRDMNAALNISGLIGSIMSMDVISIPDTYFPAKTSALIGYGQAMVTPMKLQMLRALTEVQGIDGVVCEGRIIHDAFVLDAKAKAFAMLQTA